MGSLSNTMRMKALACARGCSDHHFDIDACSVRHAQMGRAFRGRGKEHPRPRALPLDGPSIAIARSSTPHAGVHHEGTGRRGDGAPLPFLQEHLQAVSGGDVVVRLFLVLVEDREAGIVSLLAVAHRRRLLCLVRRSCFGHTWQRGHI